MYDNITITNSRTKQSIYLSTDNTDIILEENGLFIGQIQNSKQTFKNWNEIGRKLLSSSIDVRPVTITGWVVGSSLDVIKTLRRSLSKVANVLDTLTITYDEYSLSFNLDDSIKWGDDVETDNECMCKFFISGDADYPLWLDENESLYQSKLKTDLFTFPFIIPPEGIRFSETSQSLVVNIQNDGDIPSPLIIRFQALSEVVNPSLIKLDTQELIKINKTMSANEIIIIDTENKSVYGGMNENELINYYIYRDKSSTWLTSDIGNDTFRKSADDGELYLDVEVFTKDRFYEVF